MLWSNITSDGKADQKIIHAGEAVKMYAIADATRSTNIDSNDKNNVECHQGNNGNNSIETKCKGEVTTKKYGLNT